MFMDRLFKGISLNSSGCFTVGVAVQIWNASYSADPLACETETAG